MARRTWVQDPDTGKLIPKEKYRRGKDYQHYVQGDVEAFVSPIDGSVIDDRGKLRRHNARHGVTDSRDYSQEFLQSTRERRHREQERDGRVDRIETIRRLMDERH